MMPNYPPLEFKDPATGNLTGMDYDLGTEIGKRLNRKISWQEIGFEQMVNAVATKRVDMILSGMTDTKPRQDIATFVDYYNSGPQFYTTVAHKEINTMLDLCGKKSAPAAVPHSRLKSRHGAKPTVFRQANPSLW